MIWDSCLKCKFNGVTRYKQLSPDEEQKVDDIVTIRMEVAELRRQLQQYKKMMQIANDEKDRMRANPPAYFRKKLD